MYLSEKLFSLKIMCVLQKKPPKNLDYITHGIVSSILIKNVAKFCKQIRHS